MHQFVSPQAGPNDYHIKALHPVIGGLHSSLHRLTVHLLLPLNLHPADGRDIRSSVNATGCAAHAAALDQRASPCPRSSDNAAMHWMSNGNAGFTSRGRPLESAEGADNELWLYEASFQSEFYHLEQYATTLQTLWHIYIYIYIYIYISQGWPPEGGHWSLPGRDAR